MNGIANCITFNIGLADSDAEMILSGRSEHTGTYTFRPVSNPAASLRAPVRKADDFLNDIPADKRTLVKIDTEGFEHRVVRGMSRFLQRDNIGISVEVTDAWLRQTGSSAAELFEGIRTFGFDAYRPAVRRRRLSGLSLTLQRVTSPFELDQYDLFFAKPGFLEKRSV